MAQLLGPENVYIINFVGRKMEQLYNHHMVGLFAGKPGCAQTTAGSSIKRHCNAAGECVPSNWKSRNILKTSWRSFWTCGGPTLLLSGTLPACGWSPGLSLQARPTGPRGRRPGHLDAPTSAAFRLSMMHWPNTVQHRDRTQPGHEKKSEDNMCARVFN